MYNSVTNVAGGYDVNGVSVTIPEKEPEVTPTPDPEEPEMSLDEMASEVVRLTNKARLEKGIAPLQYSQKLSDLAFLRAKRRSEPRAGGEQFPGLVENWCESTSALGFTYKTVESVVNGLWLRVSGNRDQIMNPDNTYTGVGLYTSNDGFIYWIQLFSDFDPERTYTVTLDPAGGIYDMNGINYFIVPYNGTIYQEDLPIPTLDGYTFNKWTYKNNTFSSLVVNKNITLTATWK